MPDDAGYKVVSPDEWRRSFAAKRASASVGYREVSPDEWRASFKAKRSGDRPTTGPIYPGAGAPYDPSMVEKYEGGGLQAPIIDPIDLATFGVAGFGEGLAKGGIEAGLREAGGQMAGLGLFSKAQQAAEPVAQGIPGAGPVSQVARGIVRQGAGMLPFVAAGALPGVSTTALRGLRGQAELETAARTAGEKESAAVTERATEAQESIAEKSAAADKDAGRSVAQVQERLTREAQPEAEKEVVSSTVPPPSGAGILPGGAERIARQQDFRAKLTEPQQRFRADWRQRRDAVLSSYRGPNPEAAPLQRQLAEEQAQWPPGHAPYSAKVKSLLAKAAGLFQADPEQVAAGQSEVLTSPTGFSVTSSKSMAPMMGQISRMSPEQMESLLAEQERRFGPEGRQKLEEALRQQEVLPEHPSVPKLQSIQSEANAIARASKGADRTAALRVVRGVDDSLAELNMPELKRINAEYRDHREHFPYAVEDAIQSAPNPLAAAKLIFADPERVLDLKKLGTREEGGYLNQLYADYVHKQGVGVFDPDVLKALGLPGPLTKPEAWLYADKTVDRLDNMLETSPRTRANVGARLSRVARDINNEEAIPVVKEGIKRAKALGQTGQRIIAQINAADTPYEKAQAVVKAFSGLNIEQLAHESGEQAGARAIQEFVPKQSGFRGMLRRYSERAVAIGGTMALFGQPNFLIRGLIGTGMTVPVDIYRSMWLKSLQNPETALATYRALLNPGTDQSLNILSRGVINSLAPAATKIEPEVTARGVNPVVKGAESKRVENIAGPHADATRLENVKTVSEKIARPGKPANVDLALKTGRVSIAQVRDMLDAGGHDLSSVFKGLSMQDSIDTLAKASPQEREMFLPVIAQKIQDEAKGKSPQEQQFLVAQLKAVMGEAVA